MLVLETNLESLEVFKRGKVRDVYDLGDQLLIVATDRISAFDVVLPNGIPGKGKILTQISQRWFKATEDIIPNHLISTDVSSFPDECQKYCQVLEGRSMLVIKTKPLPVECVVRGYLAGSGWKEYFSKGSISGVKLPAGLREAERLDKPIFTPSTKAAPGMHDENISFEQLVEMVGKDLAHRLREVSLAVYGRARQLAEKKGIIIADTKFEFGLKDGKLFLIDELLTPDSSRFWPQEDYQPGRAQKSFDKQFVRDYLNSIDWDKKPPAPQLPPEIVQKTSRKYQEALKRLWE
jgi:phosphoribosylaminoimidazole-succinocarboxamide synthase